MNMLLHSGLLIFCVLFTGHNFELFFLLVSDADDGTLTVYNPNKGEFNMFMRLTEQKHSTIQQKRKISVLNDNKMLCGIEVKLNEFNM